MRPKQLIAVFAYVDKIVDPTPWVYPQLERAISEILRLLAEHPIVKPMWRCGPIDPCQSCRRAWGKDAGVTR